MVRVNSGSKPNNLDNVEITRTQLPQNFIEKVIQIKSTTDKPQFIDGQKIGLGYLKDLIGITSDKATLQLASKGVFTKDDFVCWGGVCYNPVLCLGAENSRQVTDAWEWFTKKLKVDTKEFVSSLEQVSILDWLIATTSQIYLPKILNLAVDLYRLNGLGVDISKKILEINKNVVGNFRKASRFKKKIDIMKRHRQVAYYLADLAAETRIALVAKLLKYDTKLHMAHDVIINGLNVQVKYIRKTFNAITIANAIEDGFTHGAKIVAVSHDIPVQYEPVVQTLNGRFFDDIVSLYTAVDTTIQLASESKTVAFFFTGVLEGYMGRVVILP
jgi:hypothetical protein